MSTYHAYAARLVRDHALRLGREPGARLITPATSWQLAQRAVGAYDGPMDAVTWAESTVVQAVLSLAGDLSEHLVDPERPMGIANVEAGDNLVDSPGLLDGAAGVSLVLASAATGVEPTWDRILGLA